MTLLSMTGFGQGAAAAPAGHATIQLASVNNRSLAIHLRSELHDVALEEAVRHELKAALVRGSITAHVAWRPTQALTLDLDRLERAWRELAERARGLGAPAPSLEAVANLVRHGGAHAQAIAALRAMRAHEGAALARDLDAHVASLRAITARMRTAAAGRSAAYRESLAARLREVLAGQAAVTPELLVREVALHAERIDVSEELVRLDAHLAALGQLLAAPDDACGRKLEFLLQEVGREVNTTGAKANDAALAALAVDAKYVIEQMREQAANVA